MFDLHTWVHLDEDVLAVFVDEKLDGTRTLVINVLTEPHGIGADLFAQLGIQELCRGNLDDFLVAALQRAVTLVEVDDVALRIRQHLHLNVLWFNHRGFQVDTGITESGFGLTGGLSDLGAQLFLAFHKAHTASATTGHGLNEQRVFKLRRIFHQRVDVRRRLGVLQRRQASLFRSMHSGGLVTSQVQSVLGGADELNAVFCTLPRQIRALREETITRVDSIRAGFFGSTDDFVDVQISLDRLGLSTNAHCLISKSAVE